MAMMTVTTVMVVVMMMMGTANEDIVDGPRVGVDAGVQPIAGGVQGRPAAERVPLRCQVGLHDGVPVDRTRHTTHDTRHTTHDTRHTTHDTRDR
jgi:hypothetical protein